MKNTLLKDFELMQYAGEEIIFALLSAASEMNYSYACWKLPKSLELNILVDFSENVTRKKAQLEKSDKGFILQHFLQNSNEDTLFLNADILFSTTNKELNVNDNSEDIERREFFLKRVVSLLKSGNINVSFPVSTTTTTTTTINSAQNYIELVSKAKEAIQENRFKKIVLARTKSIETETIGLEIVTIFKNIVDEYPNALVSLVYTKETGAWLTATPEILTSIDKNGIFKTIALAGTQLLKAEDTITKAVWTQKEIEEQALVSRYIINCFKKIRLREYEEEGPRTIQSGNLLHLRTDYSVNTQEVNFPELGTVMLELLHPTSAVCGMPKEVTLEFIKEHEGLDRKLFSGYLGPVNINSESHIFVNLRCANLFSDKVVLYAGAGVTQDSEPEKEYLETELKMEAVGRFITGFNKPS